MVPPGTACYAHTMCMLCTCHVGTSICTSVPSLSASTFPYRYIDPLLNDSAQATPVTDGYAVGVTLLQALTGRPVANLKVLCRTKPYPNPYPSPYLTFTLTMTLTLSLSLSPSPTLTLALTLTPTLISRWSAVNCCGCLAGQRSGRSRAWRTEAPAHGPSRCRYS